MPSTYSFSSRLWQRNWLWKQGKHRDIQSLDTSTYFTGIRAHFSLSPNVRNLEIENWKFSMNRTHSAFHVNAGSYRHRKNNRICPHFAIFDLCTIRKGDEKVCYWGVWPVYHHWSQLLPKFCITRNIRRSPSRGARSRFFLRILRASSFWAGLVGCEVGSHLCKWT